MYKKAPSAIPKNMKNLISPLLKIKIEYKTIIPVIIQNIISSIYVTKSLVLKLSLKILKKSNHLCYNVSYGKNSDYSDC